MTNPAAKYELHMVTMSHWDREWYLDFQAFRIRLVHLIDGVLDILDRDPAFVSYMLDGQTIPLEDYLEVKPQNRERLKKHIEEGRIVIGPWYILPDEILISGESHIRNYLMGERVSRAYGKKMNIGYLPDSFGHPSQMPQILSKLGMEATMFWRGSGPETDKTELYWEAPDGSKVLTVLLPAGYSTGAELPNDPAVVAARLDKLTEVFEKRLTTDMLYVSNGGDHLEPVPYLSSVIAEANKRMKRGRIIHTTLPRFFAELKKRIGPLDTVKGEMLGVNKSILLGSTLSTRMHLKQLNYRAYTLLESVVEPVHAFADLLGCPYPKEEILNAWRYFLKNMPHDSVCGCSVDEVHRDMLYRYDQVFEIADYLMYEVGNFFGGIDTKDLKGDGFVAVFNSSSSKRTDVVEAVVDLDDNVMAKLDFNDVERGLSSKTRNDTDAANRPLPTGLGVFDGEREVPCVMIKAELYSKLELHWQSYPTQFKVNRCHVRFLATDVPPSGYKTFSVVAKYDAGAATDAVARQGPATIENAYYRATANEDGSFDLLDKDTGIAYKGCNSLVDSGDCGDEYTYCPPERDTIVVPEPESIRASVAAADSLRSVLRIEGVLMLPETVLDENQRRSEARVSCPFSYDVSLYSGVKRVEISASVTNKARYHRLRAIFPTNVLAKSSFGSGIFSVDERPIDAPPDPNWQELISTHPQKAFSDVNDGKAGLMLMNKGLPEYEAFNENGRTKMAITLLRCVGEISKKFIKTRKGMGGWTIYADGGQCLGDYSFEYGVIPHRGTWESEGAYLRAMEYAAPLKAVQAGFGRDGKLPAERSFVGIEPSSLVITAFKRCDFEDGMILRFYNSIGKAAAGKIVFGFPVSKVELAGLNEVSIAQLPVLEGAVRLNVDPWSIVTLKIKR